MKFQGLFWKKELYINKTRYWEHQIFHFLIPAVMKSKQNIYYVDEVTSIFVTQEASWEFFKYSFIISQKLPAKNKDTV